MVSTMDRSSHIHRGRTLRPGRRGRPGSQAGKPSVLSGLDLHQLGSHTGKSGVVRAQGGGGLGVDGDQAARHLVIVLQAVHAPGHGLVGQIGRFGTHFHLVTYTTMSANLMLREIGIVLFLASVGIDAGANFVQTVVEGDGLLYVGCGFLITVIPLLIIGAIARLYYKVNYFTLMGLIAGSNTDPPALAYANQTTSGDAPAVGYSTVYPLSMFLRILTGQMILLTMM